MHASHASQFGIKRCGPIVIMLKIDVKSVYHNGDAPNMEEFVQWEV